MVDGYTMYLNGVQMPITPSRMQLKIKGKNKTMTLANDLELNTLRLPGLTEIGVTVLLPMVQGYGSGGQITQLPDYYIGMFEVIQRELKPVQFILSRLSPGPNGRKLYDTNTSVSLESYTIDEDAAKYGLDVSVSLVLKQYIEYGTKTMQTTSNPDGGTTGVVEQQRETNNAPSAKTYTVQTGDNLFNIAKKYYGNGADYMRIFDANTDQISNPNQLQVGQVITLP